MMVTQMLNSDCVYRHLLYHALPVFHSFIFTNTVNNDAHVKHRRKGERSVGLSCHRVVLNIPDFPDIP